jgi:hypothetical protein
MERLSKWLTREYDVSKNSVLHGVPARSLFARIGTWTGGFLNRGLTDLRILNWLCHE